MFLLDTNVRSEPRRRARTHPGVATRAEFRPLGVDLLDPLA